MERYDRLHYMNTGTEAVPVWSLINEGIVTFDDDLAPITETKQYIADKNQHDVITGYKPTFKYSAEIDSTDVVNKKLYDIGADQKIGETCEIVSVDMWDLAAGVYTARKATYNVIPSKSGSGDAGAYLKMEGSLSQVGDIVKGTWTIIEPHVFTKA